MAKRRLTTTKEVVEALGGFHAVAELTGSTPKAAENWRRFDNFPPNFFLIMTSALERKNLTAPSSLWRMTEPERAS